MVTLYQNKVMNRLRDALTKKVNMVSVAMKVDDVDPISFFEKGDIFFHGQRFYWSDCFREKTFVGLGEAHVIATDEATDYRFDFIEKEWSSFVEGAFVEQKEHVPIMFGGFSFDPQKQTTDKWEAFPSAKWVVPTFLLTKQHNETWLTVNIVNESLQQLEEMIDALFARDERKQLPETYCLARKEVQRERWMKAVEQATRQIRAGDIEKVVLARELALVFHERVDYGSVLRALHEQQPMSYIFAIENGTSCFLGASPEQLVKKVGKRCETACLAGSVRRGKTLSEDERLGEWLLNDEKNRREHEFVVRMIRQAMEQGCETVTVPPEPTLLKMRHIQHLYTPVKGYARDGMSILQFVKRLHPTPALGGYPQQKAVETIRALEPLDRGWYAAPIGWIDMRGDGEFIVAIRSALIRERYGHLFAGCGIVSDSDARSEYEETNVKFQPMLSALLRGANE